MYLHRDKNKQGENRGEMGRSFVTTGRIGGISNLTRRGLSIVHEIKAVRQYKQTHNNQGSTTTGYIFGLAIMLSLNVRKSPISYC